jgi:hypothetical protein
LCKLLVTALKSSRFHESLVDTYLRLGQSRFGDVTMAVYVHNCLTIGKEDGIQEVIEDL